MIRRSVCLSAYACLFAPALAQPQWSADFAGPASGVRAVVGWDEDGAGQAPWTLFVAGQTYGPLEKQRILRWDGQLWTAIGSGITDGTVSALALFNDGSGEALYAAGNFKSAGGKPAGGIARWNGSDWAPVGAGLTSGGGFSCLAAYDEDGPGGKPPALFAGGFFAYVDGKWCKYIARWDGQNWSPVGGGMNDRVAFLVAFDPDDDGPTRPLLVAAGDFRAADGQPAEYIASWNGSDWTALGAGVNGPVNDLAVFAPAGQELVFVGGEFSTVGDAPSPGIAAWDGSGWLPIPGLRKDGWSSISVNGLAAADPDGDGPEPRRLFIGGDFACPEGVPGRSLVSWSAEGWHAEPTPETEPGWLGVADEDGPGPAPQRVFLQGGYDLSIVDQANFGIAVFERGVDNIVNFARTLDLDGAGPSPPVMVIGGQSFRSSGAVATPRIAGWDGKRFFAFGGGFGDEWGYQSRAFDAVVFDADGDGPGSPRLYATGMFWTVQDPNCCDFGPLLEWDGVKWLQVAKFDEAVSTLEVFDPDGPGPAPARLYAGGSMNSIGNLPVGCIASWDGQTWENLGGGVRNQANPYYEWVSDLQAHDFDGDGPQPPRLVVGGHFDRSGDLAVRGLAVWDGQAWSAIGDVDADPDSAVGVLADFDADGAGPEAAVLVAAGSFEAIGGVTADGIAMLGHGGWDPMGQGLQNVQSLATHDDGSGLALYAGGGFSGAVARWQDDQWSVVGSGLDYYASSVAAFDDDGPGPGAPALYAVGRFYMAGDVQSDHIARWGEPAVGHCEADCDRSGSLDVFDFLCFVNGFNAGQDEADCDGSGGLDVFDFLCFVNAFNGGC